MENVNKFIVDYIQREYTISEDVDVMNLDYVESGYVDSIGMIQFISVIEDEFNISFSDDELADPDIKVVGKLIDMVVAKLEENS